MTFKNILLHMDVTDRCQERLNVAGELALAHDANLTGLYVTAEPFYPMYAEAAYFPEDLLENFEKEDQENREIAEKKFRKFTEAQSIHNEWQTEQGALNSVVTKHARYASLSEDRKGKHRRSQAFTKSVSGGRRRDAVGPTRIDHPQCRTF